MHHKVLISSVAAFPYLCALSDHTHSCSNAESHYVTVLIMLMKQKSNVCKQTWRSSNDTVDSNVTRTRGITMCV